MGEGAGRHGNADADARRHGIRHIRPSRAAILAARRRGGFIRNDTDIADVHAAQAKPLPPNPDAPNGNRATEAVKIDRCVTKRPPLPDMNGCLPEPPARQHRPGERMAHIIAHLTAARFADFGYPTAALAPTAGKQNSDCIDLATLVRRRQWRREGGRLRKQGLLRWAGIRP